MDDMMDVQMDQLDAVHKELDQKGEQITTLVNSMKSL